MMQSLNARQFILDDIAKAEIIQSLLEKLLAFYVFPEIAEQICANVQKSLDDGKYSDFTQGEIFALALTMDMQEVNHDEHLWVRWHAEPLPEQEDQLRKNQEWQDERRLAAKLENYGLHKVERLPGNVGYLDIHYFQRPAWGGDTAAAAMAFLANMSGLIIDLRRCTGGYPGMIALICSYLFGEEPVHLDSIYWRDEDVTQQYWTLPYIPGKRFLDIPVYVLISKNTFSGGEEFAYILQTRRRAMIIGEKTDGGAHPGASYRLHPHFEVFIPIGRSISPITKTDWEGRGVIPDLGAEEEKALKIAHILALKSILANPGTRVSEALRGFINEVETVLKDLETA